mmetsp:Transcript_16129/g.38253  ORF Transcript_16129/g.38253 Transcript_16129/m.38253 type:complete len:392 (+) Transcript_16129:1071-2246(+)
MLLDPRKGVLRDVLEERQASHDLREGWVLPPRAAVLELVLAHLYLLPEVVHLPLVEHPRLEELLQEEGLLPEDCHCCPIGLDELEALGRFDLPVDDELPDLVHLVLDLLLEGRRGGREPGGVGRVPQAQPVLDGDLAREGHGVAQPPVDEAHQRGDHVALHGVMHVGHLVLDKLEAPEDVQGPGHHVGVDAPADLLLDDLPDLQAPLRAVEAEVHGLVQDAEPVRGEEPLLALGLEVALEPHHQADAGLGEHLLALLAGRALLAGGLGHHPSRRDADSSLQVPRKARPVLLPEHGLWPRGAADLLVPGPFPLAVCGFARLGHRLLAVAAEEPRNTLGERGPRLIARRAAVQPILLLLLLLKHRVWQRESIARVHGAPRLPQVLAAFPLAAV